MNRSRAAETLKGISSRLCVITDEISQDFERALRLCYQEGIQLVELRSVSGKPPLELTLRDCAHLVGRAERYGIRICSFASPALKCDLPRDRRARAAARDTFMRSMDVASWLGVDTMRVFAFWRDAAAGREQIATEVASTIGLADDWASRVLIENGTGTNAPTLEHVLQLRAHLVSDAPGVLWDPGNEIFSGGATLSSPSREETAAIAHVHVKDPVGTEYYTCVGAGDIDWAGLLAGLAANGFEGPISLETHWRIHRRLTPSERECPWGREFSAGGYLASRLCVQRLQAIVRAM